MRREPGRASRLARETGGMLALGGRVLRAAVRPPYSYGAEFVTEFRFALGRSWFALIAAAFAFSFGPAGVQGAGFLGLFGALDRLGGLYELIIVREFAPFVTAIVVAGVVGTALCADLGARKVREEIDALGVLGVDVVKGLVVPRFLVIVALSLLFNVLALLAGVAGATLVEIQNHQPLGPFFANFRAAANVTELLGSYVKCLIFGATIAIVCCYQGLSVSGGSEGVGRAVNRSVVISFLAIGAIDYVYGQLLLATHPGLSEVR
ncbi:ABC transporter permease [Paraconexibacter antarcticus]|uniref:ABC transporter permease n=1 Tax=Paraconexibacter antarcticus TaxID=2949664 RepID=A0ABY5DXB6_9ACTN|nr:ABC transporter permease [Paraconexibacter antarcticus]UTI66681.1 ABC transporter permease [Paraconexibacter antarcticus]